MDRWQISLVSLLLLSAALPIWMFLFVVVPPGIGSGAYSFLVAPMVLGGITVAIHRLFRGRRDAWAFSALLAAVIAYGSLSIAGIWMAG